MNFQNVLKDYLKRNDSAYLLFEELVKCGDIYLIGGVLREYKDCGSLENLRDIDIVVDVKDEQRWNNTFTKFSACRNRFGGSKVLFGNLPIDTWDVRQTWAYREGIVVCNPDEYISKLSETIFLNIDGIIYDWKRDIWNDKEYCRAMDSRVLDVVLESNPQIPLNIVRAFILQKRYSMSLSERLTKIIITEAHKYNNLSDFARMLEEVERRRYGKLFFSNEELLQKIKQLLF